MPCLEVLFEALQALSVKTEAPHGTIFADSYFVKKRIGTNERVPYIPGSSFKGAVKKAIRYALKEKKEGLEEVEDLFNIEKGGLRFEDCDIVGPRLLIVKSGISINKALGTVMEKRLFYQEKAAPGTRFSCKVCGNEEALRKLEKLLEDELVRNYFYYVGLGDGMVKLVEVKRL